MVGLSQAAAVRATEDNRAGDRGDDDKIRRPGCWIACLGIQPVCAWRGPGVLGKMHEGKARGKLSTKPQRHDRLKSEKEVLLQHF